MPLSAEMPAPVRTATDWAAERRSRARARSGMDLESFADLFEDWGGLGAIDTDDGGAFAGGAPAREHAGGGEAGEDADQGDTASGGDVLAGGIVSNVERAGSDDGSEAGERAFPEGGLAARTFEGAVDAIGFGSAGAGIDDDVAAGGREESQEVLLEGVGEALGLVFADAEADGDVRWAGWRPARRVQTNERGRPGDGEGLLGPVGGEFGERAVTRAAVGAAFEEAIAIIGAHGQEAQLREA